jgi:uncharacterized protein YbcI
MEVISMESQIQSRSETISTERGQLLADVSNAIVRIHKQYYGKGPVKARAHISHDLLTVILEGGFTRGEQTLQDHGHAQEVVRSRLAMQQSIESEFRTAVEKILYRSVRSFMSANDPSNDLQAEIFVLHPRGSEALEEPDGTAQLDGSAPADGAVDAVEDGLRERAHRAVDRNREVLDEHRALRSEHEQTRKALQADRTRRD